MRTFCAVAIVLSALSTLCSADTTYVVPTTTLSAQTANNSSAANTFTSQSNGNRGAGNLSKVDVHSLLYSGASTKVYAHMMVWFGQCVRTVASRRSCTRGHSALSLMS